jgi:hypothetical protein
MSSTPQQPIRSSAPRQNKAILRAPATPFQPTSRALLSLVNQGTSARRAQPSSVNRYDGCAHPWPTPSKRRARQFDIVPTTGLGRRGRRREAHRTRAAFRVCGACRSFGAGVCTPGSRNCRSERSRIVRREGRRAVGRPRPGGAPAHRHTLTVRRAVRLPCPAPRNPFRHLRARSRRAGCRARHSRPAAASRRRRLPQAPAAHPSGRAAP